MRKRSVFAEVMHAQELARKAAPRAHALVDDIFGMLNTHGDLLSSEEVEKYDLTIVQLSYAGRPGYGDVMPASEELVRTDMAAVLARRRDADMVGPADDLVHQSDRS